MISVILPVYNVDPQWLDEAIQSVLDQIYPHWELCLADDASPRPEVRECLGRWEKADTRIKIDLRSENGHISRASNSALALAEGEFVALLDHDDRLASHALARIADALAAHPDANLVFTDEDKIDQSGYRSQPTFKSGFNPDLLTAQNCISHLGVYRRALVEELGGFRAGMEGAQDWDLALRVAEKSRPDQIVHIPEVLYHWRSISGSTASDIGEKSYAHEAGRKAVEAHLARTGQDAAVEPVERFYWRARYRLPQFPPRASIVIPTRDRLELLRPCIESIQSLTTYPTFEIVVVDNDSSEAETRSYLENALAPGLRVVPVDGPFNFAAICNLAVSHCDSEVICLLNNDIQIESGEWLEEMVSHVCRPEIGAVGARLLYPHGHVQHAGIVMGIGGVASEAFKGIHCEDDGYIHRAHLVGNYSAVTGACLAVRKAVWQRVDGMDAKNTPNAYSDVDFCLRVSEAGWRNLYTPFATLRHRESASRGPETATDRVAAFEQASAYMHRRWASVIADDPFYNPNLTLEREDFTLSRHPRGYRTN